MQRPDRAVVEVDEEHETGPRCSLVAVGQRMIPRDPAREHRGLVVQVRVEVRVAEAGLGCVQCRIGELDTAGLDQG